MDKYTQLHITLDRVLNGGETSKKELEELVDFIDDLEYLLDITDREDFFGPEGWKSHLGLDE
jgi:hypothetical protein